MPTGGQQRCESEATHSWSVTRKFACMVWVVVVAGACDGSDPPPDVDPNDLDGDGIPNAEDLCPQRFDQMPAHDEDGDLVGDPCDNCPTVANADQTDLAEGELQFPDGVGDACDPRPTRAGDKENQLFTFATDPASAFTGSGWSVANDRAIADGDARWTGVKNAQGDGVAALAIVPVLTWLGPASTPGAVRLVVDGDGVITGLVCSVERDTDGDTFDEVVATVIRGAQMRQSLNMPVLGEVTIRATRLVSLSRTAALFCHFENQGQKLDIQLPTEDAGTGIFTFAATGAHAEVSSLVVYTAPFNHGGP
jgi:hypothetical protein